MHLLGLGGILACVLGIGLLLSLLLGHVMWAIGWVTDSGFRLHDRPAMSLGVLLMVVGVQFFSLGLLGELLIVRAGSRSEDRSYSVRRIVGDDAGE
jgi:hypothetical protein